MIVSVCVRSPAEGVGEGGGGGGAQVIQRGGKQREGEKERGREREKETQNSSSGKLMRNETGGGNACSVLRGLQHKDTISPLNKQALKKLAEKQ